MGNPLPRVQPLVGREGWLDEPSWRRLRQALDDGCDRRDIAARFGISYDAATTLRGCRTLEDARARVAKTHRRKRLSSTGT